MRKTKAKSTTPQPQRMKSTPANSAERKTARPSKTAKVDTPRVAIAPPPLERKRSPKI